MSIECPSSVHRSFHRKVRLALIGQVALSSAPPLLTVSCGQVQGTSRGDPRSLGAQGPWRGVHFFSMTSLCLDMAPSQSCPLENHATLGRRLGRKTSPASLFIVETVVPAQACAAPQRGPPGRGEPGSLRAQGPQRGSRVEENN